MDVDVGAAAGVGVGVDVDVGARATSQQAQLLCDWNVQLCTLLSPPHKPAEDERVERAEPQLKLLLVDAL